MLSAVELKDKPQRQNLGGSASIPGVKLVLGVGVGVREEVRVED